MNQKEDKSEPVAREDSILWGFVARKQTAGGRVSISVRWGRLIGAFVILIVLGWLSLGALLYFHFKYRRGYDEVSYVKMLTLLPFGVDEHRVEVGDFYIRKGLKEMQRKNFVDAIKLLRSGVSLSPANLEGRKVLSEFYEAIHKKDGDQVANLLMAGIEKGGINDLEYLKRTLRVLLKYQMDDEIQKLADQYLPEEPEIIEINRTLAFGAANANYLRGNYDQAEDYLVAYKLLDSIEGILLSAQISWERGDQMEAIAKLKKTENRFKASGLIFMQLSRYYREIGDLDESRRYAILRLVTDPLSPIPRIQLLYIYNQSGDEEEEEAETQRMLKQFRDSESALKSLGNFAANTGNSGLARRIYEEALENAHNVDSFALLLIEAHLVREDYQGALEFAEELLREDPDWLEKRWSVFNSLRAVASYGVDRADLGEIYLRAFLDDPVIVSQTCLAVAQRFSGIGRFDQARRVLLSAYAESPGNQKLLSELIRVKLELGNTENLDQLLLKLLQMRRPQMELLADAYTQLGSDRFIFAPDRETLLTQLSATLREDAMNLNPSK